MALSLYNAAIKHVDNSDWAYDIRTGLKYTSPFDNEEAAYDGPTTMPNQHDVLIETRYKSRYLALYNDFISHKHPGNRLWNELIDEKGRHLCIPPAFCDAVAEFIVSAIHEEEGRFLYQSPNAQWVLITDDDAKTQTAFQLAVRSNPIKQHVITELEFLIQEVKYNHLRESNMSIYTLPYLLDLKIRLTTGTLSSKQRFTTVRKEVSGEIGGSSGHHFNPLRSRRALKPRRTLQRIRRPVELHIGELLGEPEEGAWVKAGDFAEVTFIQGKRLYRYKAQVTEALSTGVCIVYFPGQDYVETVPCKELKPYISPKVGDIVEVHAGDRFYRASILREKGGGLCDRS